MSALEITIDTLRVDAEVQARPAAAKSSTHLPDFLKMNLFDQVYRRLPVEIRQKYDDIVLDEEHEEWEEDEEGEEDEEDDDSTVSPNPTSSESSGMTPTENMIIFPFPANKYLNNETTGFGEKVGS